MSLIKVKGSSITGDLPAISGANLTGISAGITEYDIWRISSGFTGDANPVTSNLERCDDTGFEKIGTGMSESSGVFTFPSTGKYIVHCFWEFGANLISI